MNLFGWELRRKSQGISIDTLIRRLEAIHETVSGINVTPETAMQSPTVHSLVTAISRRISTLPVHVFRKTMVDGRANREPLPNHPAEKLLNKPNDWQNRVTYWADAASWLIRYGNFYAFKARGQTGPIRKLIPLHPSRMRPEQQSDLSVIYKFHGDNGEYVEYLPGQIHHVRSAARDGVCGDSPVHDVSETIALEIAAEKFGASFFGNGAMPLLIFKYAESSMGHKTDEERKQFIEDFQNVYAHRGRHRAMLLPKGIESSAPIAVDNDKHQFIETRKLQRTFIAGAFGVPSRFVGDLENAHFNNVEQQSLDFTQTVILPIARQFEAAMESDLLTPEDRASGVIIRFNLDAALRGDFLTRQQGLKIQREAGIITPNEWREHEGMNPLPDGQGGDDVWQQGPSGQTGPNQPENVDDSDTQRQP